MTRVCAEHVAEMPFIISFELTPNPNPSPNATRAVRTTRWRR